MVSLLIRWPVKLSCGAGRLVGHDLLMTVTAVVLSLTVAALPAPGQQQRVRGRRPIPARL